MNVQDTEEIVHSWISTEFNPVEGENMWQNQSPPCEAQQDDQHKLQITLQEVIDMIDMLINVSQEETTLANVSQEEIMLANVS